MEVKKVFEEVLGENISNALDISHHLPPIVQFKGPDYVLNVNAELFEGSVDTWFSNDKWVKVFGVVNQTDTNDHHATTANHFGYNYELWYNKTTRDSRITIYSLSFPRVTFIVTWTQNTDYLTCTLVTYNSIFRCEPEEFFRMERSCLLDDFRVCLKTYSKGEGVDLEGNPYSYNSENYLEFGKRNGRPVWLELKRVVPLYHMPSKNECIRGSVLYQFLRRFLI